MATMNKIHQKQCISVALLLLGLFIGLASLMSMIMLPSFITNQINQRLVLKNGSTILNRWSKPNVPIYFKVWLFDVKNAQQVIDSKGTKPILKEIGPFVFRMSRSKDIISFAGDNVYYTEKKVYHFSPELSCCAMNTTVTIPNIPLVAIVDRALSYNLPLVGRFIPRLINRAIQSLREQLFVRRQVNELLFDGYDVELLKMVSRVGSLVGLPQTNQKFALLKGRNDTWRPEQDGVWGINTGQRDRKLFGRVSSWNSYKQLPFWTAPSCNAINGSDGTLFVPPIRPEEPLYVFNPELCRTINLIYEKPSEVRSIEALRFVLNPLNFAPTMMAPEPPSLTPSAFDSSNMATGPSQSSSLNRLVTPAGGSVTSPGILSSGGQHRQSGGNGGASVSAQRRSDPLQTLASNLMMGETAPASGGQRSPMHPTINNGHHNHNHAHPVRRFMAQGSNNIPQVLSSAEQPTNSASSGTTNRQNVNLNTRPSASAANQQQEDPKIPLLSNRTAVISNNQSHDTTTAQKLAKAAQEAHDYKEQRDRTQLNPLLCFCDRKGTYLNGVNICEFDGLIDMSKCAKQTQVIFGSMPHFHSNDPRLLKQVHGLEPNATKHTTYLDIEPNTGLVLGGKRRFQLNIMIKHNLEVEGFENIADMLVPIMWIEESALIPEESAKKFKSLYTDRIRTIKIVLMSLIFASVILVLVDVRLMLFQSGRLNNLFRSVVNLPALSSSKQNFSPQKAVSRHHQTNYEADSSPTPSSEFLSSSPSSQSTGSSSASSSLDSIRAPESLEKGKKLLQANSNNLDLQVSKMMSSPSNETDISELTTSESTLTRSLKKL